MLGTQRVGFEHFVSVFERTFGNVWVEGDMEDHHETPDIEVEADDWGLRQRVLAEIAAEDEAEERWANVNSCDALRIIDGVPLESVVVVCSHDWHEPVDSQFSNEFHTEVKCSKCGMVGEKTILTGEVFYPAT